MNQAEAQHGHSDAALHPPREKKKNSESKRQAPHSYLRSVDFDGNVVALRRPLGGFGHLETGSNQVNTELALRGDNTHQLTHQRRPIRLCAEGGCSSHQPVDIWLRCSNLPPWRRGQDGPAESGKTADL